MVKPVWLSFENLTTRPIHSYCVSAVSHRVRHSLLKLGAGIHCEVWGTSGSVWNPDGGGGEGVGAPSCKDPI